MVAKKRDSYVREYNVNMLCLYEENKRSTSMFHPNTFAGLLYMPKTAISHLRKRCKRSSFCYQFCLVRSVMP